MKKRKRASVEDAGLRRRAEERLKGGAAKKAAPASEGGVQHLVHELQVHEIELEMQNEELRGARVEVEAGLARYTELFDFAPIGYATLAPDETIREINHAGARLLGEERSRLAGQRLADRLKVTARAVLGALLGKARHSEAREICEMDLARDGEAPLYVRLGVVVLAHAGTTFLVTFEDIREQRAREERLASAERALREANRRKDEFLAVLSHELRNPLAPIRNSLFVLDRTLPAGERARKSLAVIDRQVAHLTRLIDDLLDVTRISRGKIRLHRELLDLGELVCRTMEDHRTSFESSGIELEGRFAPGGFWVYADAARLVQAVSNLLGNAEKFTPRGGSVAVSVEREGDEVVLRIRDTGAGIPPEMMDHLFEPFAQAPQTMDRARGGLGLGLAMVKGLLELHGGTIAIASDGPGRGTSVTVSLPLEAAPVPVADSAAPRSARNRRVLVIEDHYDAAESLRDALSLSGHEVEVAYDGPRGIELARAFRPEVVVCDIGLPGMDGYEVAKVFRADEALRGAYLVALTGYAMPEDLERAAAAGFDRHVTKPPTLDRLERLLGDAPSGRG